MGIPIEVKETRRTIVFTNGDRLDLTNVIAYDNSGTWLRIWSDDGFIILNPELVLYHKISVKPRVDEQ